MSHHNSSLIKQHGAVLAICLILLLVMTVIGVSAMNSARLEISMAGLMQKEEVALRRAERTLMEAEESIDAEVAMAGQFEFSTLGDAYYITSDELNARKTDWSSIGYKEGVDFTADGIDNDDTYVIEYLGWTAIAGGSQGMDNDSTVAGDRVHAYRITARSASGAKSIRIIESIYTTFGAP
ncbi:MAG: type IV pilus assembly protein PilX [Halioglobus sp.]|jgi:type IV pilus assembly protein PilX